MKQKLTLNQMSQIYRQKPALQQAVLLTAKARYGEKGAKYILYGSAGLNEQLDPHLKKKAVSDFDFFVEKKPRFKAKEMEHMLDTRMGFNAFSTVPGKSANVETYKVVNNYDGNSIVDFTLNKEKIQTKQINGLHVQDIRQMKQTVKKRLADPKAEYRRAEDTEQLRKIKIQQYLDTNDPFVVKPIRKNMVGAKW
jgi:hypothetical protein